MNSLKNTYINSLEKLILNNISKRFFIVVFVVFFNCKKEYEYEYESGVRFYLKEEFDLNTLNGRYYFFLLDDCESCLSNSLNLDLFVANNYKNVNLIIVGNVLKKEQLRKLMIINKKYNVYRDFDSKIYSFNTGFGKSLLLDFRNNKIFFSKIITDGQINTFLAKYLN